MTVELSELDAVLWDAFNRGGEWVNASEYRKLMAQNAKLRSICAEVAGILFNLDVDRCGLCGRDSINHPCPAHTTKCGECLIKSELRELGVVL